MARWTLESLNISGGFLPGLDLMFPSGLTCIIGPRGSGKSTLMEAIRYGLVGVSPALRERFEVVQANLSSSVVTLRTRAAEGGASYIIRRTFREPASLLTTQGAPIANVNLERGTFLPLDAYTSSEVEAIADETFGEKRRALLDELRSDEIQKIVLKASEERRALEASADSIGATRKLINDLTEQIEELGSARGRLQALPTSDAGTRSLPLENASHQHFANDAEAAVILRLEGTLEDYANELIRTSERFSAGMNVEVQEGTANEHSLAEIRTMVVSARSHVDSKIANAVQELNRAGEQLKGFKERLFQRHADQKKAFDELQRQDTLVSQTIRERSLAEQAVRRLENLEKQRDAAKLGLSKLLEKRKVLKGSFLLTRDRISNLREETASSLENEAGKKVRIRVLRNSDDLQYQQSLTEGLRGARVRNHEDILRSLLTLRPEQLAQIIQENDLDEFEVQLSLGRERSQKVLEAFRQNLDPLTLETTEIEDRICIELNVGSASDPNFRDAAQLSRGQKCTALLPILLARRDTPLVIDQPEDNLDNHFIYETVVESIRRLKSKRQMIFITHNANIPVLGEADLVVVLDSDGTKGFIRKSGSLDECRDEIVDLLEGGDEAFELRRKRYANV